MSLDMVLRAGLAMLHLAHHQPAPLQESPASWYEDTGQTASGEHFYYGVANKSLRFGTRIRFFYRGRTVVGTVDDRGPYVGDRVWDLNQNTARVLGFAGVGTVFWRLCGSTSC